MAHLTACQHCSGELRPVLDMGYQPLVNEYWEGRPAIQASYPQRLCMCARCGLAQLDYALSSDLLFPESYPYTSGTTGALAKNAREMALEVEANLPYAGKLVLDIGSNDGTLLQEFKDRGARVVGVTPEDAGRLAEARGIPTVQAYWGTDEAAAGLAEHGQPAVVTACNVLAHVPDPEDFVRKVATVLEPGGLFVSDSHYVADLFAGLQFDAIYGEHLRYYSAASLTALLTDCGLEVAAVKRTPTHGGSIRVYARKPGGPRVNVRDPYEENPRHVGWEAAQEFAQRALGARNKLRALLANRPGSGARVHGLGAPSRASTLLNWCGVTAADVPVTYEVAGSLKIGKRMPGSGVLVLDEKDLYAAKPEYLLLLSWHLSHELMPKLRHAGYLGKFVLPLPEPRVA